MYDSDIVDGGGDAGRKQGCAPSIPLLSALSVLNATTPPLPPLLANLDRLPDGSLDLRHWRLSGRFQSAKLARAYSEWSYAVWRPRLRLICGLLVLIEIYSLISSIICHCGVRFGVYSGPTLVYAYCMPSSVLTIVVVILSPRWTKMTAETMAIVCAVAAVVLAVGYTQPLAAYLRSQPQSDSVKTCSSHSPGAEERDEAGVPTDLALKAAESAAWYVSTIVILLFVLSTSATSLGVGTFPLALFLPIPSGVFLAFNYEWFEHFYGFRPDLLSPTLAVYFVSTILTYAHNSNARQEFIVRIYVQSERDARVEQLQREKERLDYERQFALRSIEHSPTRRRRAHFDGDDKPPGSEGSGEGGEEGGEGAPQSGCASDDGQSRSARTEITTASEPELMSMALHLGAQQPVQPSRRAGAAKRDGTTTLGTSTTLGTLSSDGASSLTGPCALAHPQPLSAAAAALPSAQRTPGAGAGVAAKNASWSAYMSVRASASLKVLRGGSSEAAQSDSAELRSLDGASDVGSGVSIHFSPARTEALSRTLDGMGISLEERGH